MKFKDQFVRCGACGKQFVYTVREQRYRAEHGLPLETPAFCPECRGADVRLADAAAVAPPSDARPEAPSARAPGRPQRNTERTASSSRPTGSNVGRRKSPPPKGLRGRGPQTVRATQASGPTRRSSSSSESRPPRSPTRRTTTARQTELRMRFTGNVKWFDRERGYGFIAQEDGADLFVHSSAILGGGPPILEKGQPVEYEVERTARGLQAVDVVPLAW